MSRPPVTVLKALRRSLKAGSRLLLAVSGGVDSVVMLHGCVALQREFSLTLEVAHVDHGLRAESGMDADFVKQLAKSYSLALHLFKADRLPAGENAEAWGRKIRYRFFAESLEKNALNLVATAHNANDVAETFLMRLIANKELRSILAVDEKRRCIRPLLAVPRDEIDCYAKEHKLEFREDPTNQDQSFLRNKIRHLLIKQLQQEFDLRIVELLSTQAQGVAADIELLSELADQVLLRLTIAKPWSKEWLRLLRQELNTAPQTLRWRIAERLVLPELGFNLGRSHSEALVEFFLGNGEGIELPGGCTLKRHAGGIVKTRLAQGGASLAC